MGSVPGDSDFQSDWSDQPKPSRGLTRPDLGSMPMTKPQFGGSLSALGSGPLGSEPGFAPPGGPGGPLGIINYRLLTTKTNLKVFKLADRMRSMRTNGASRNPDSSRCASKLFSIGSFCMFLFRRIFSTNFFDKVFDENFMILGKVA